MDLYRLPTTVKPINYDLTLYLTSDNLQSGRFTGEVIITVKVSENVTKLLLHASDLNIEKVQVNGTPATFHIDAQHELLEIDSAHAKGNGEIYITFAGSMVNKLVGLYTSTYKSLNGVDRTIATTKFEPTHARQAFPCFDEPNFKAYFTIHVIKPKDTEYIALSNMPIHNEVEVPEGIKVTFEETIKMSTYLLCFVLSDLKSTDGVIKAPHFEDIDYRVFATAAQLEKTEYAAFVGKKVMEHYLDYFEIPFPMPKLDMLAIPNYSSSATEHWGIVTYRETSILFDTNTSSTHDRRNVATVVAHELAHSWFGNLVTMDWWNDLWLNVGFASYIEYKGVNAVHPEWKMWDQFILDIVHKALIHDATLDSYPLVAENISTPDEISQLFVDPFYYQKAAAIIGMLENSFGSALFKEGVTNYLKQYKFANTVTLNLVDAFQTLVGDSLRLYDYWNSWTSQRGYPIIYAARTETGFRLTQSRFLTDPDTVDRRKAHYNYKWTIPVTYFTAEDPEPKLVWFKSLYDQIDVNFSGKYLKFNAHQVGYYRVNYETADWNTLIANINAFNVADRAHLLEESFRIAESTLLSYDIPLNLSKYLLNEFEYVPWSVAGTMLQQLQTYLMGSTSFDGFKEYVINLVTPAVNHYTWNETSSDSDLKRFGRSTVLGLACAMGAQSCLDEAKGRLHKYLHDGKKPSPDLKELVYKYGMVNGNKADWEKMWSKFTGENDAGEKTYLLSGLAAIKDESQLQKLLDFAKDDTYIRKQDYPTCIANISNNDVGNQLVWVYFKDNWVTLVERFGLNDRCLHNMIPTITCKFYRSKQKEEMQAFFAANPDVGVGENARELSLETVQSNINWRRRNKASVESWIENNK